MQVPVIVSPQRRTHGTVLSEASIGAKTITTPAMAPKVKNAWEFRIVCDNIELEKPVSAVVYDIHSVNSIVRERRLRVGQRNLMMERADKNYDHLLRKIPQIVDPNTEAFYWNLPTRANILRSVGYEKQVEDMLRIIDYSHYNGCLRAMLSQKLLWSYVDTSVNYQAAMGADIVIAPSFPVSGHGTPIDLLYQVHERTTELLSMGRFRADIGAYVPIVPKVFSTPKKKAIDDMLEFIEDVMPYRRFLFLKLTSFKSIKGDKAARKEYGNFLEGVDAIKEELDNKFMVILLDAGAEGAYTLLNGVDVYCEPVDGLTGFLRGGAKGDDEDSVTTKHGNYLHTELGTIPFTRLLQEIGEEKILPCSCPACDRYHENLGLETPVSEWNVSRRAHRINLRMRDVQMIRQAATDGSVSDVKHKIDRGEDRNLIDIVPYAASRTPRR